MKKFLIIYFIFESFIFGKNIALDTINVDFNATQNKNSLSKDTKFNSSKIYDESYLQNQAKQNGVISDIVKKNPNVRISRGDRNSKNPGEINPENFSINGAEIYQNNFLVDGISINNDINPVGNGRPEYRKMFNVATNWLFDNQPQGINIDTDLLESIELIDSGISAKYGNFQGGVINSKTRDPYKKFGGKINFSHTRDSWMHYFIDDREKDDFYYSTDTLNYQPDFQKYKTGLLLEGFLSDNFGLILNYNQTLSEIYQRLYYKDADAIKLQKATGNEKIKLKRKNENLFLKGVWYASDNLIIRPKFLYNPTYFSYFYWDTKGEFKNDAYTYGLEGEYNFSLGNLKQNISYMTSNTFLNSNGDQKRIWWHRTDKNLGYGQLLNRFEEGNLGDINQKQENINYNLDFALNDFKLKQTSHKIILGFDYTKTKAKYEILEPYKTAYEMQNIVTGDSKQDNFKCKVGDIFCKMRGKILDDYYFRGKKIPTKGHDYQWYKNYLLFEGSIKTSLNQFGFYLEDEIKYKNITFRPGFRLDKNDYMGGLEFSPRLNINIANSDESLNIFGGFNRYYGRSIFAYKFEPYIRDLQTEYKRDKYEDDFKKAKQDPNLRIYEYYHKLKLPYDDEINFGFSKKFDNFEFSSKFVNRKGKNIITRMTSKALGLPSGDGITVYDDYDVFTNKGQNETNIFTLNFKNLNDLKIFDITNNFEFSLSKIHTTRKLNFYNNTYYPPNYDGYKVLYKNSLINDCELPKNQNKTPWVANFNLISKFKNFTISNFVNFSGGYKALVRSKTRLQHTDKKQYWAFYDQKIKNTFGYDMKILANFEGQNSDIFYISLDIFNVLNLKNISTISNDGTINYENGRNFWLEVGYKW